MYVKGVAGTLRLWSTGFGSNCPALLPHSSPRWPQLRAVPLLGGPPASEPSFSLLSSHNVLLTFRMPPPLSLSPPPRVQSFTVEIAHEETVVTGQVAYLQAALLYTNSNGERRILVHTLALPVVAGRPPAWHVGPGEGPETTLCPGQSAELHPS